MKWLIVLLYISFVITKYVVFSHQIRCKLDIAFAIDESRSIWFKYYDDEKQFARKFINIINISPDNAHSAMLSFAGDTRTVWNFDDPAGTQEDIAVQKLHETKQAIRQGEYTCIEKVLQHARTNTFILDRIRPDAMKALVLISDGNGNCASHDQVMSEAQALKNQGVEIFTIAAGEHISEDDLKEIASRPSNFFHISAFDALAELVTVLTNKICTMADPTNQPRPAVLLESVPDSKLVKLGQYHFNFGVLIENSNLVSAADFEAMKSIPIQILKSLETRTHESSVSVMFFAETTELTISFSDHASTNIESMKSKLQQVRLSDSSQVCSAVALTKVARDMFGINTLESSTKILIIVLNSPSNCHGLEDLASAAEKVKTMGIIVFVMMIGSRVDRSELILYSSGGSNIVHIEFIAQINMYLSVVLKRCIFYAHSITTTTTTRLVMISNQIVTITSRMDYVILFENSATISNRDFDVMLNLIAVLIKSFGVSSSGSRVSLVSYNDIDTIYWDFNHRYSSNEEEMINAVNSIQKSSESRICLEKGLFAVGDKIFTESTIQQNIPRVLIVVSYQSSNCGGMEEMRTNALRLRDANILIVTIGYGSFVSETEMILISSNLRYYWKVYQVNEIYSTITLMSTVMTEYSKTINRNIRVYPPAVANSVDMGFIVTDSVIIDSRDFSKLITTIINSMSQLSIGISASRVSVMINSNYPKLLWKFTDDQAINIELAKQSLMKYTRTTDSVSCLEKSLEKAKMEMFLNEYQRSGVHRILIILTSESSLCSEKSIFYENIQLLHTDHIYVIVLAIGTSVDQTLLRSASSGSQFYFYYQSFGLYRIKIVSLIKYIAQNEVGIEIDMDEEPTPAPVIPYIPEPDIPSVCTLEMGMIFDESLSVSSTDFDSIIELASTLIRVLKPSKNQAHTSIMLMSNIGRMIYRFTDPEGSSIVLAQQKLANLIQSKGSSTCIGKALYTSATEMFAPENVRQDAKKALIVFSDGGESCGQGNDYSPDEASKYLKATGVTIHTVGVGVGIIDTTLKSIASSSTETYFSIADYKSLISSVDKMIEVLCSGRTYEIPQPDIPEKPDNEAHCNARLLFLVDNTYENYNDYQIVKDFMASAIEYFMTRKNHDQNMIVTSKTAITTYNENSDIVWDFDSSESTQSNMAKNRIQTLKNQPNAKSCLGQALEGVEAKSFSRPAEYKETTDIIMIISRTTNNCFDEYKIDQQGKIMRQKNIKVINLVIGNQIYPPVYKKIVTEPNYFYNTDDITIITEKDKYYIDFVCRVYPEPPSINYEPDTTIPTTTKTPIIDIDPPSPVTPSPPVKPLVPTFYKVNTCNARLLYILDEAKIGPSDQDSLVSSVGDMLTGFLNRINIDKEKLTSKSALLKYGNEINLLWNFESLESQNSVKAISTLTNHQSNTLSRSCMDSAFDIAIHKVFKNPSDYQETSDIIILIISNPNDCSDPSILRQKLETIKNRQIKIIVVTVGRDESLAGLVNVASVPNYFIQVGSYQEITSITDYLVEMVCRIPPSEYIPIITGPPTTTPYISEDIFTTPVYIPPSPPCNVRLLVAVDEANLEELEYSVIKNSVIKIINSVMKRTNDRDSLVSITAAMAYSETPTLLWNLLSIESVSSKRAEQTLRERLFIPQTQSCNELAIDMAKNNIFSKVKENQKSTDVMLLIASNVNNCGKSTNAEFTANLLKGQNVAILVLATKLMDSFDELKVLATSPNYFYNIPYIEYIESLTDKIVDDICTVKPEVQIPPIKPVPQTTPSPVYPPEPQSTPTPSPVYPPEPQTTPTPSSVYPPEPQPTPTPVYPPEPKPQPPPIIHPEPEPQTTPSPLYPPEPKPQPPPIIHPEPQPTPIYPPSPPPPRPIRPPHPTPYKPINPKIPQPTLLLPYTPRVNKIRIVLKICKDMLVKPIGCLPGQYLQYYNHPLKSSICKQPLECNIPMKLLKNVFCECSKKSRILGLNSFAITSDGSCYGNRFLHKIARPSILSNRFCKRHDGGSCNENYHTCIGKARSIYVYANA